MTNDRDRNNDRDNDRVAGRVDKGFNNLGEENFAYNCVFTVYNS